MKYFSPLINFNFTAIKGKWFVKGINPLPSHTCIYTLQAWSFLPFVIAKDKEIIIKDSKTKKIILAVYCNHIGPNALAIMQETIKEMMQLQRKVFRNNSAELN